MGSPVTQASTASEPSEILRRRFGLIAGPAVAFLAYLFLPGLPADERRLAAVLSLVVVFWVTEAIPIPVTALLGPAVCVLLGISNAREVFSPFASPIVYVFLGGFLIARAMMANGLDRRIALAILRAPAIGTSPARIRVAVGLAAGLLSMWISNTATVAMLFPIVLGIGTTLERLFETSTEEKRVACRRYVTGLLLMTAYGSSVGGLATPIGTPPNLVGREMMETATGVVIPFFDWMLFGVPIWLGLFLLLVVVLHYLHPPPVKQLEGMEEVLGEVERKIPPWGRAQTFTGVAFLTAVTLWVLPGVVALTAGRESALYGLLRERLQEGVVALLAASLLFLLPVSLSPPRGALRWRDAAEIDWGTILLFGGGLSLGSLMHSTGLAERFARSLLGDSAANVWVITAVAVLFATFLTELTSNLATASMLVPVTIAVAQAAGVSPLPPAMGATIGCSLAFMLPVSTPPNAIMYGSGRVSIVHMIRAGLWMDILGFVLLVGMLFALLPLLGWL